MRSRGPAARKSVSPFYVTLISTLSLPILLLVISATLPAISMHVGSSRGANLFDHAPAVTLWAWERDEDMSFVDPSKVSVSYFAGMIYVRNSSINFRPRTQRLKLAAGTQTIPVFRIETLRNGVHGKFDASCADHVVEAITTQLKTLSPSNMVQIDFDALEDERSFYTTILRKLRKELPSQTKISITALSSWLLCDKWLKNGDADEVVSMLFSIGADKKNILDRIQIQKLDSGTNANLALGISANETSTNKILFGSHLQTQFDRLYIFNSHPWTRDRFAAITKEAFQK
jgi:hypothetical protein